MTGWHAARLRIALLPLILLVAACSGGAVEIVGPGAAKSPAHERAKRRAFDGAPPVPPHDDFGMTCTECHNMEGMEVPGVGYAPPSPHEGTMGLSAVSRCRQCHVFSVTDAMFSENGFVGLTQDLRRGRRLNPHAPPVIPHPVFMRENCAACHAGPSAREEIRTSHPDRIRCRQCHVTAVTRATFEPA